jgi:hypothetical protein
MLKTLDIVLVALVLFATTWTFGVKHEAEIMEERLRVVERGIAHENETISLLEADWSLLNRPERLQRLATTFEGDLGLRPIEPRQMVTAQELPAEPARFEVTPDAELESFAANTAQRAVR